QREIAEAIQRAIAWGSLRQEEAERYAGFPKSGPTTLTVACDTDVRYEATIRPGFTNATR
ncbi:MAG: hypothetical protein WBX22_21620, partial [Silvibacterium sp.]